MKHVMDLILTVPDRKQRWATVKTITILRTWEILLIGCASKYEILKNTTRTPTGLASVRTTEGSILGRAALWHEFTTALGNVKGPIHVSLYNEGSQTFSRRRAVLLFQQHVGTWTGPISYYYDYYYLTRDGHFILWICTLWLEQIWYTVMEVFTQEA
jgi:hypothetical protein